MTQIMIIIPRVRLIMAYNLHLLLGCDWSGRAPAWQVWGPAFKPQCLQFIAFFFVHKLNITCQLWGNVDSLSWKDICKILKQGNYCTTTQKPWQLNYNCVRVTVDKILIPLGTSPPVNDKQSKSHHSYWEIRPREVRWFAHSHTSRKM
jgi:hypothetical protein